MKAAPGKFDLARLLRTVFAPRPGERIGILIDLPDPSQMREMKFLSDPRLTIQRIAHDEFYSALHREVLAKLDLKGGEMVAYQVTGGSNLDLPRTGVTLAGEEIPLEDVYSAYDILLCISTYSATAPLTAFAKRFGFRGATLHGVNEIILQSGLCKDYEEVSRQAEKLRLGMTRADAVEIDFHLLGQSHTLRLDLGRQEAQKSHGLCRGEKPDVANLPAGEIYYVPAGAEGFFPLRFEDGTIGLMKVSGMRIVDATLLKGSAATLEEHRRKIESDPAAGEIGELGFGTQYLPVSGRDIQDEKILGTLHIATGRSDHLGGSLTPDKFKHASNATHEDILFAPHKTPEIAVTQVRMQRDGESIVLIENFEAAAYMKNLLARPEPAQAAR
jgi:aminopeptidase